jgi:hypothetical protein
MLSLPSDVTGNDYINHRAVLILEVGIVFGAGFPSHTPRSSSACKVFRGSQESLLAICIDSRTKIAARKKMTVSHKRIF